MSGENPFQKNLSNMVLSHEWGCDGKNVGVEICFSFRPHPVRISNLLFPLYTMRHVQEHAAQLNLFLGQNAIDGASDWVSQGKAEAGGE